MTRDRAWAYIRNRLVLLCIILLIAVFTARFLFPKGDPVVQRVQGTIIEINQGGAMIANLAEGSCPRHSSIIPPRILL